MIFSTLHPSPATHLRLWQHSAITQLAAYLIEVGGPAIIAERFPFMEAYLAEVERHLRPASHAEQAQAWRTALAEWEHALPDSVAQWPLLLLRAAGVTPNDTLALMLASLVEVDARFGAVYATLHPFPDEHRLTVGLLDDILRSGADDSLGYGWATSHRLAARGLLLIHKGDEPRAARPVSLPGAVWDACGGERAPHPAPGMRYTPPAESPTFDQIDDLFPAEIMLRLRRAPGLLAQGALGGLILRGMQGSGRRRALGAVARALGRGLLEITRAEPARLAEAIRSVGPLATLLNALPVVDIELAPGEHVELPELPGYVGPLGVLLGLEGGVQGRPVERCVSLRLPAADQVIRRRQWQRSLAGAADERFLDDISEQLHLTIGGIERAATVARAIAALDGRTTVARRDVREAGHALNRESLDALAAHIDTEHCSLDTLVVSDSTRAELANLLMRCRRREAASGQVGPGFGALNRGVRALLGGPSGTGKTLAARIIVAELGLDLYRVDLASIVNKYIGETERNLSRLFARAEEQDVVLLFDEGDSLFTGRTDVRSSNDRYANMETNYLLQRMEHYDGIVLITTNAVSRIDSAFQRRMDVYVEFSAPGTAQRLAIWKQHLPAEHGLGDDFLRQVAARCQLSGGQIRNAALHAIILTVEQGRAMQPRFIAEAVAREYQKFGATSPLEKEVR